MEASEAQSMNVREQFGNIDIYLFDQLLKGRIAPGMRVLDAGCGNGRNLVHFLREGYDLWAVDRSAEAVEAVRALARELAPGGDSIPPEERFRLEPVEKMSFANDAFDVVISCAVLHFADSETHFQQMVSELWRVLKPGGLLFARLASGEGLEDRLRPLGGGRYVLPDGSERFLADSGLLGRTAEKHHALQVEPLKTVNVENLRCMTTWCLKKPRILFFDPIEECSEERPPEETGETDVTGTGG